MGRKLFRWIQALGFLLILCGAGIVLQQQLRANAAVRAAEKTVAAMEAIMPERTEGVPDSYTNLAMPVLEVDGEDYIGIVEIPAFGVTLPVGSEWDPSAVRSRPCRFWGSVNDASLVIGGADQKGQFDFCDRIDLGAFVTVTDMTGVEFRFTVTRVDRNKHAQADWLCKDQYDLTLFARSATSLEYIAVRCDAA